MALVKAFNSGSYTRAAVILEQVRSIDQDAATRLSAITPPSPLAAAHTALVGYFRSKTVFEQKAVQALEEHSQAALQHVVAAYIPSRSPYYDAGRVAWVKAVSRQLHAEHQAPPAWLAEWVSLYSRA